MTPRVSGNRIDWAKVEGDGLQRPHLVMGRSYEVPSHLFSFLQL